MFFSSYLNRIPSSSLNASLSCQSFIVPQDVLFLLTDFEQLRFRGYEARLRNLDVIQIEHGASELTQLEGVDVLTLNASYPSSDSMLPTALLKDRISNRNLTLILRAGARLTLSPLLEGLARLTVTTMGEHSIHAALSFHHLSIDSASRFAISEIPDLHLRDDTRLSFSSTPDMAEVIFQSMTTPQRDRVTISSVLRTDASPIQLYSDGRTPSQLSSDREATLTFYNCSSCRLVLERSRTLICPSNIGMTALLHMQNYKFSEVRAAVDRALLDVNLSGTATSVSIDGGQLLPRRFSQILEHPWYELGPFGVLLLMSLALGVAVLKRAIDILLKAVFPEES